MGTFNSGRAARARARARKGAAAVEQAAVLGDVTNQQQAEPKTGEKRTIDDADAEEGTAGRTSSPSKRQKMLDNGDGEKTSVKRKQPERDNVDETGDPDVPESAKRRRLSDDHERELEERRDVPVDTRSQNMPEPSPVREEGSARPATDYLDPEAARMQAIAREAMALHETRNAPSSHLAAATIASEREDATCAEESLASAMGIDVNSGATAPATNTTSPLIPSSSQLTTIQGPEARFVPEADMGYESMSLGNDEAVVASTPDAIVGDADIDHAAFGDLDDDSVIDDAAAVNKAVQYFAKDAFYGAVYDAFEDDDVEDFVHDIVDNHSIFGDADVVEAATANKFAKDAAKDEFKPVVYDHLEVIMFDITEDIVDYIFDDHAIIRDAALDDAVVGDAFITDPAVEHAVANAVVDGAIIENGVLEDAVIDNAVGSDAGVNEDAVDNGANSITATSSAQVDAEETNASEEDAQARRYNLRSMTPAATTNVAEATTSTANSRTSPTADTTTPPSAEPSSSAAANSTEITGGGKKEPVRFVDHRIETSPIETGKPATVNLVQLKLRYSDKSEEWMDEYMVDFDMPLRTLMLRYWEKSGPNSKGKKKNKRDQMIETLGFGTAPDLGLYTAMETFGERKRTVKKDDGSGEKEEVVECLVRWLGYRDKTWNRKDYLNQNAEKQTKEEAEEEAEPEPEPEVEAEVEVEEAEAEVQSKTKGKAKSTAKSKAKSTAKSKGKGKAKK